MGRTEALVALPIGFGKTVVTLTALAELRKVHPTWRALLVSTKNICEHTWPTEIEKWGFEFSYRSLAGRKIWLYPQPDIISVNFESLEWMLDVFDRQPILMPEVLIIDESSKMKSSQAKRVRRLIGFSRRGEAPRGGYVHRFQRRWLLSGSPAPEGLEDLWAQEACMSTRRRLGENITCFREQFCSTHWNGFANEFTVHAYGKQEIERKLARVMYVPKEVDDLGLVPATHSKIAVPWSAAGRAEYEEMENRLAITPVGQDCALGDEEEVAAANAGVVLTKLRQLCSGFVYGADGRVHRSADPDAKGRALDSIIELADGAPILVFTQYIEEMEYLASRYRGAQIGLPSSLDAWNARTGPDLLVLHPRSAGHGLNLQGGSHICVFYSLPYSYEEWFQAWGRLQRRGQENPVSVIRLEREESVEIEVWQAVQGKQRSLSALLNNMRERRRIQ